MADDAAMLHDLALAFGASANFRTLLPRLTDALGRHLPVVEVEIAELDARREAVRIAAMAADTGRRWQGERSLRFLERSTVRTPGFVDCEGDLARVSLAEVAVRLQLPAGRRGLVTIAFDAAIAERLESTDWREMFVDSMSTQVLRMAWLAETADRCREAHLSLNERNRAAEAGVSGITDKSVASAVDDDNDTEITLSIDREDGPDTDISISSEQNVEISVSRSDDGISVTASDRADVTDMAVKTLDQATIDCICRALSATSGKIYGDDGAAAVLGLHPSTLQSKMRKLGIERRRFVPS